MRRNREECDEGREEDWEDVKGMTGKMEEGE